MSKLYYGWIKPIGKSWRLACMAPHKGDVRELLLEIAEAEGSCSTLVLRAPFTPYKGTFLRSK